MVQLKILEQRIFSLYQNNKAKKWQFNLEIAQLFVMHAGSTDIRLSLLKTNINLCKSLSNWQFHECIISSFLFCIECKKSNEAELKTFVSNSMYNFAPIFLSNDVISKNNFSFIIMKLNLVELYPLQVVVGFVQYLTPARLQQNPINNLKCSDKKNIDCKKTVQKILCLFPFFSSSFIKKCTMDCEMLGNFAPLSLALHVLYVNSISYQNYRILVYDKNYTLLEFNKKVVYKELETFKKQLIHLKLVNYTFISKCNFFYFKDKQKKIPFKNYYSFFDSISTFQTFTQELRIFLRNIVTSQTSLPDLKIAFFPVELFLGIGLGIVGMRVGSNRLAGSHGMIIPESRTAISAVSIPKFQRSLKFNSGNFVYSQSRVRFPLYASYSEQPALLVGFKSEALDEIVYVGRYFVDIDNARYYYDIVTINGEGYFSTFGTTGRYQNMPQIQAKLRIKIKERFKNHKDIMEKIREVMLLKNTNPQRLSYDHTSTSPIRLIHDLSEKKATTFAVPGQVINGLRTNNTFQLQPYTEYDTRVDPLRVKWSASSSFNGDYTVRSLLTEAFESNCWMWFIRMQLLYPEAYFYIEPFKSSLHIGMQACAQAEFEVLNEFYMRFNSNIDSSDSVVIYQFQCLHYSKLADITDFSEQKAKYYKDAETIITKPYALELFLKTAREKYKLGVSLECFLSNASYLKQTQADRIHILRDTIVSAENYIASFKNDADFDYQRAQTELDNFKNYIADDSAMKELYSADECHRIMDEEIQLGFFYQTPKFNGKDCNYSVYVAKTVAKNKNEDVSLYVQENIGLQPQGNSLASQNLYSKIEKADSLIEKLKIIKGNVPENFLDFAVRSLHIHTEEFYVKGIEFPNPNLELNQWLVDNVSPATRVYLKEQTLNSKLRSASKPPQAHVITDIDDQDQVIEQQSQSTKQRATEGADEVAQDTQQPLAEKTEQPSAEKTEQFYMPLGRLTIKRARNATINLNLGGAGQAAGDAQQQPQAAEQADEQADELHRSQSDELPSAPPYPYSASNLRRSQSDELPSAPPYPYPISNLRRSQSEEMPSAPTHTYQGARQGAEQAAEQADGRGTEQAA